MAVISRYCRMLAVSSLLAAVPLSTAGAQAVEGALQRLKELVQEQGATIEWESARIDGARATLSGVTVGSADNKVPLGTFDLEGISQDDDGYRIEEARLDRYFVTNEMGSLTAEGMALTGLLLPNADRLDHYGGFLFYETARLDSFAVNSGGKDLFTVSDVMTRVTEPVDGNPMDFDADGAFFADLSFIEDPAQAAIINALGYQQLNGSFAMAGSWQPEDGRMALSQYDIQVNDAGTLGLSFDIGGYTREFVSSLRELNKQMAANPNPEGDASAQQLAVLGLIQQLSFHSAEIAFTDDSLTGKALEVAGAQQGVSAQDAANLVKGMLPFVLGQLNAPELAGQITQAVSAFLDNPQKLRVTAKPAQPVPFAMVIAAGMVSPQDVLRTLGVTVSAND